MLGLLWRFMKHFYTSITSDFTQRLYAIHLSITSGFVRNGGFTTQFSIGRWFSKPPDLGLSNCAVNIPPKPRWSSFSLRKTRDIWGVVRFAESVISFLLLNHGWESIPPSLRLVGAGSGGGRSPEGRRGGGVPQSSPWALTWDDPYFRQPPWLDDENACPWLEEDLTCCGAHDLSLNLWTV